MRTLKEKGQRSIFARRRADICPPGFYTSGMLRDRLNISMSRFRALARAGVITANKHNDANNALYSEEEVQKLLNKQADGTLFNFLEDPSSYCADDGVRVFELLAKQTPLTEIVVQTRLLPTVVQRIVQKYDEMNGSLTIPKPIVDQMNGLRARLTGAFPLRSASSLLDVLTAAAEDRTCTQCNVASCAELCVSCLRPRLSPPSREAAPSQSEEPKPAYANGHANGSSISSSTSAAVSSEPRSASSQNVRQP